ncbi:serine protease persephone-like isoform X2 [Eriocheir sinensis]|uniref:serine protease persephone-like isoform X2 n=1 Tax=Eriocheir sinensis TaxID=95602 RepID=UPI0021C82838|nr:serine protease persephone-like isoform X2 [Eriocheir sinensis]
MASQCRHSASPTPKELHLIGCMVPRARTSLVAVGVVVVAMLAALLPPLASAQVIFPNSQGVRCVDREPLCPEFAERGACETNPTYTRTTCPLSCKVCQDGTATATTSTASNRPPATEEVPEATAISSNTPPPPPAAAATSTTPTSLRPAVTSPGGFRTSTTATASSSSSSTSSTSTSSSSSPSRPTSGKPSIVYPDFECGGARRARKRRQAPSDHDSSLSEEATRGIQASDAAGENSALLESSCGASVISRRFLLTAAHCIDPENPISAVRLGDLDLTQDNENNSAPADYDIIQIIIHPQFRPGSSVRYNDIALLQTDREIEFNDAVFPYCISPRIPATGTTVIAAGYGLYNETYKSHHVLEGELDVMSLAQCENEYLQRDPQRLKTAYPNLLPPRGLLCAGRDGGGVCKGDEGGPLYREDESGLRFLEGITSLTGGACKEGLLPGLFTAVADHVEFIDAVIYNPRFA